MATSLLDQREVKHLLQLHAKVACIVVIVLYFLMSTEVVISAASSYGCFLVTWLLSAYYAFRYRGAQQIKSIIFGFYWGAALRLILTLLWVATLMQYWQGIDWLIFLLVMLLSYLVSLVGGVSYYRRSACG
jgi:F0F1-type ATP synthase assembly protein I